MSNYQKKEPRKLHLNNDVGCKNAYGKRDATKKKVPKEHASVLESKLIKDPGQNSYGISGKESFVTQL